MTRLAAGEASRDLSPSIHFEAHRLDTPSRLASLARLRPCVARKASSLARIGSGIPYHIVSRRLAGHHVLLIDGHTIYLAIEDVDAA